MSNKNARIASLLDGVSAEGVDRHYAGYFACFNLGKFYEAHEVLESLWLPSRHETEGNFYKGLIQLAGAFVHLQRNRLRPANALFALADANLAKYPDTFARLDVTGARELIARWRGALAGAELTANPLAFLPPPVLNLLPR